METITKFDQLCEEIMNKLGCDYDIKYYANTFTQWTNILTATDKLVVGAMRINNGQLVNMDDTFSQLDNIIINLMIPSEGDTYKKNIAIIDNKMPEMLDYRFNVGNNLFTFSYQGRSEASKQTINGQQYALVTLNGILLSYKNIVLSKSREITIDGVKLKGILDCNYGVTKTSDAEVYGITSPLQKNDINAVVVALDVTIAAYSSDDLHKTLLENANDITKSYEIAYNNGIITRTNKMILNNLTESTITGDKLICKLSFIIGA